MQQKKISRSAQLTARTLFTWSGGPRFSGVENKRNQPHQTGVPHFMLTGPKTILRIEDENRTNCKTKRDKSRN